MRKTVGAVIGCSLAATLAASACSDANRALGPARSESSASESLLGGLTGTVTELLIRPVERTTPLAAPVTWTFRAGPSGGFTSNASVGLTVFIPSGALSSTQTITVTALAGSPVAYRFEPHLVFNRKVYLTQSLSGTNANLALLFYGAHFAGDLLELNDDGLASVTEIVSALLNPFTHSVTFGVKHFSGWLVGSGHDGTESDGQ